MPNLKNAKKALRHADRRRSMNIARLRQIKTLAKKLEKVMINAKEAEIKEMTAKLQQAIDKAVKTGSLKANTANRKKSRLLKKLKAIKK